MALGTHKAAKEEKSKFCKKGHEFTIENSYIPKIKWRGSRTKRFCKKCIKEKNANYYKRKQAKLKSKREAK